QTCLRLGRQCTELQTQELLEGPAGSCHVTFLSAFLSTFLDVLSGEFALILVVCFCHAQGLLYLRAEPGPDDVIVVSGPLTVELRRRSNRNSRYLERDLEFLRVSMDQRREHRQLWIGSRRIRIPHDGRVRWAEYRRPKLVASSQIDRLIRPARHPSPRAHHEDNHWTTLARPKAR